MIVAVAARVPAGAGEHHGRAGRVAAARIGDREAGHGAVRADRGLGRCAGPAAAGDRHRDVGQRERAVRPVRVRPEVVGDLGFDRSRSAGAGRRRERPPHPGRVGSPVPCRVSRPTPAARTRRPGPPVSCSSDPLSFPAASPPSGGTRGPLALRRDAGTSMTARSDTLETVGATPALPIRDATGSSTDLRSPWCGHTETQYPYRIAGHTPLARPRAGVQACAVSPPDRLPTPRPPRPQMTASGRRRPAPASRAGDRRHRARRADRRDARPRGARRRGAPRRLHRASQGLSSGTRPGPSRRPLRDDVTPRLPGAGPGRGPARRDPGGGRGHRCAAAGRRRRTRPRDPDRGSGAAPGRDRGGPGGGAGHGDIGRDAPRPVTWRVRTLISRRSGLVPVAARGLGAVPHVQLAQDAAHVRLDRTGRDRERRGDVAIAEAIRDAGAGCPAPAWSGGRRPASSRPGRRGRHAGATLVRRRAASRRGMTSSPVCVARSDARAPPARGPWSGSRWRRTASHRPRRDRPRTRSASRSGCWAAEAPAPGRARPRTCPAARCRGAGCPGRPAERARAPPPPSRPRRPRPCRRRRSPSRRPSDERVVVHDHHPDRGARPVMPAPPGTSGVGRAGAAGGSGAVRMTSVPDSGREATRSRPPMSAARSRMETRP